MNNFDYKFKTELDEKIFQQEVAVSGLSLEEYVLNRRKVELGLTDLERSKQAKDNWKKNRKKILKGIEKFHKSTDGKKFHRQLARFLTTVPTDKIAYMWDKERDVTSTEREKDRLTSTFDALECLIPLSSAFTHALIEKRYWDTIEESVSFNLFLEYFDLVLENWFKNRKLDWDFVVALVHPTEWQKLGIENIHEKFEELSETGNYLKWFLENRKRMEISNEDEV